MHTDSFEKVITHAHQERRATEGVGPQLVEDGQPRVRPERPPVRHRPVDPDDRTRRVVGQNVKEGGDPGPARVVVSELLVTRHSCERADEAGRLGPPGGADGLVRGLGIRVCRHAASVVRPLQSPGAFASERPGAASRSR